MSRQDQEPFCETINPANPEGEKIQVVFPRALVSRVYKFNPVAFLNLACAKWVLEHPDRVFEGIRAVNTGGWCYVGRPVEWHIRERVIAPFPDHLVFAVYINPSLMHGV